MKTFEVKKNEIYNSISNSVKSNIAFRTIWEVWDEQSDYSIVEAILNSINNLSANEALKAIELMIREEIFSERLLYKLCDMIKKYPYIIGKEANSVEKFKEFTIEIIKTNYKYSFKMLYIFAQLLEYLFALGYRNLRDVIVYLYDTLPSENSMDMKYVVHKKLIDVYNYNGMNYIELHTVLEDIYEYCRASKQKFMYGEIYYYRAVLEILSGELYSYDLQKYIDKACDYRYELANVLKTHMKK